MAWKQRETPAFARTRAECARRDVSPRRSYFAVVAMPACPASRRSLRKVGSLNAQHAIAVRLQRFEEKIYGHAMPNCAYCGANGIPMTTEHVFPKNLYPASKATSRVQRLTVDACFDCNNGWSDDEAHFRNILGISGTLNPALQELWDSKIKRALAEVDGPKRAFDLAVQMRPVGTGDQYKVYPDEDSRVLRVLRKIVRGLCHHHGVMSPVSDQRVLVVTLTVKFPPEFLARTQQEHREQDIAEYRFAVLEEVGVQSFWLLTFFENKHFLGLVSQSENGFPDLPATALPSSSAAARR